MASKMKDNGPAMRGKCGSLKDVVLSHTVVQLANRAAQPWATTAADIALAIQPHLKLRLKPGRAGPNARSKP
eukprot:6689989-Pyramimonas_sp.AAC.1